MIESDNEFNTKKLVTEYLDRFPYVHRVHKQSIFHGEIKDWCEKNFNSEFKDWFWFPGGRYDDHSNLHIRHDKWNTLFILRWGDKI